MIRAQDAPSQLGREAHRRYPLRFHRRLLPESLGSVCVSAVDWVAERCSAEHLDCARAVSGAASRSRTWRRLADRCRAWTRLPQKRSGDGGTNGAGGAGSASAAGGPAEGTASGKGCGSFRTAAANRLSSRGMELEQPLQAKAKAAPKAWSGMDGWAAFVSPGSFGNPPWAAQASFSAGTAAFVPGQAWDTTAAAGPADARGTSHNTTIGLPLAAASGKHCVPGIL